MRRIKPEDVPCKFHERWSENQAPLGSGMVWNEEFEDCGCDSNDPEFIKYIERDEPLNCSPSCPGYQPAEVLVCSKHGEYIDVCDDCLCDEVYGDGPTCDDLECADCAPSHTTQK